MGAPAIALLSLLVGAGIGYYLRAREFRREHRLGAYDDYVASFLRLVHSGATLLSLAMQYGDKLGEMAPDQAREAFQVWREASSIFETAQTRVRLVGSIKARAGSEELEDWVGRNIRSVAPFTSISEGTSAWGDEAKVSPAHVDRVGTLKAREFVDAVRPDVVGWNRSLEGPPKITSKFIRSTVWTRSRSSSSRRS
jgi:hypothetical protein